MRKLLHAQRMLKLIFKTELINWLFTAALEACTSLKSRLQVVIKLSVQSRLDFYKVLRCILKTNIFNFYEYYCTLQLVRTVHS